MHTQSCGCADRKRLTAVMGHSFDVPPANVILTIEIIRKEQVTGGQQLDQPVCVCSFEMRRAEGHLNSNYSVPEQVHFAWYDSQINYLINTYTLIALCKNKTRTEIKATSLDRIVAVLQQNK